MIQYIENTNLAYCDGYKFRKDKKTGYWLCSTLRKRLHVYIYEKYNGTIPKGMQVHHIDHNKDNNELTNLKLVAREEHNKIHYEEMSAKEKERRRKNLELNARPKAVEWHKSQEGREWHKKIYEKNKELFHKQYDYICVVCNKQFKTTQINSRFCSNKCKAKYRRDNKLDTIIKKCLMCGNNFQTNKYRPAITCCKKCAGEYRKKKGM